MPKEYEAIRDSLKKRGESLKQAKTEAAKIYNSRHPDNPNPWSKEHKRVSSKHPNAHHHHSQKHLEAMRGK